MDNSYPRTHPSSPESHGTDKNVSSENLLSDHFLSASIFQKLPSPSGPFSAFKIENDTFCAIPCAFVSSSPAALDLRGVVSPLLLGTSVRLESVSRRGCEVNRFDRFLGVPVIFNWMGICFGAAPVVDGRS